VYDNIAFLSNIYIYAASADVRRIIDILYSTKMAI